MLRVANTPRCEQMWMVLQYNIELENICIDRKNVVVKVLWPYLAYIDKCASIERVRKTPSSM